MNVEIDTSDKLLAAGRRLFARHGYRGASVRAITSQASANLGAVTYHFGSKRRFYETVLESMVQPLRERVRTRAATAPSPIEGVEGVVREIFAHIGEHREMPSFMLHELSLDRPVPAPIRRTMQEIFGTLRGCIEAGQRDGSIVAGEPMLLCVGVVAQPMYLSLVGARLRDVFGLDPSDPGTRQAIVEHVVQSVRRSLATRGRIT